MKDLIDPLWGILLTIATGIIGMFYRHGTVLAEMREWKQNQEKVNAALFKKVDNVESIVTGIRIKIAKGSSNGRRRRN